MKCIVTEELGRLAKWLRILGFDAAYFAKGPHRDLVLRSLREGRVILTRNSRVSRFTGIRLIHIDSDFVEEQLEQVLKALDLSVEPGCVFSRCVVCNEPLVEANRESVKGRAASFDPAQDATPSTRAKRTRRGVPQYVFETQSIFMRCPACGRIYWKGTHWDLVNKFLQKLKE